MNKKVKKSTKAQNAMDKWPNNHGEWLLLVLRLTERTIPDLPREDDQIMINQAKRLRVELQEWKNLNPNEHLRQL